MENQNVYFNIYNYLYNNCVGIENAISNESLSKEFNMTKRRIRSIINNINSSDEFDCFIGNGNEGYWIATENDYKIAFSREWKSVITRIKRLKNMSKKVLRNGQGQIDIDTLKSDFIEVFGVLK